MKKYTLAVHFDRERVLCGAIWLGRGNGVEHRLVENSTGAGGIKSSVRLGAELRAEKTTCVVLGHSCSKIIVLQGGW